jgi:hypothetical protein
LGVKALRFPQKVRPMIQWVRSLRIVNKVHGRRCIRRP